MHLEVSEHDECSECNGKVDLLPWSLRFVVGAGKKAGHSGRDDLIRRGEPKSAGKSACATRKNRTRVERGCGLELELDRNF